jgi:hypothetical protein
VTRIIRGVTTRSVRNRTLIKRPGRSANLAERLEWRGEVGDRGYVNSRHPMHFAQPRSVRGRAADRIQHVGADQQIVIRSVGAKGVVTRRTEF